MADPLEDPNGYLWEESTRNGVDLMRMESYLAAEALSRWAIARERAGVAVERSLSRIRSRGPRTLSQRNLAAMERRIDGIIGKAMRNIRKALTPELDDIARISGAWTFDALSNVLPNVTFGPPRPATVKAIWRKRPMVDRLIPDWWRKLDRDAKDGVRRAIRTGIVEGQTVPQIVARVVKGQQSALGVAERHLETFVRTSVSHVNNAVNTEVTQEIAKDAGLREEQWSATLDTKTCPACASLDRRRWKIGRGPVPPIHMRCLCKRYPVIPGAPAGERAAMTGPVKGDTTFADWLRRQPVKTQEEVLGPTVSRWFRQGKLGDLEPRYLIDPNNRPLPVREIRARLERAGKL